MKLIKPSVEIREQKAGMDGMFEHIEWAGRHCYKSHDKTTATSAKEFVARIAKSGHGSVLEHGTIYLAIPADDMPTELLINPYTKCVKVHTPAVENWYAVTTNYRVIVENNKRIARINSLLQLWKRKVWKPDYFYQTIMVERKEC